MSTNASYDPAGIAPFIAGYKGKVRLVTTKKPCFIYRSSPGEMGNISQGSEPLEICLKFCEDMKSLVSTDS